MKALSIQQPWAWAIFNGKPVENRTWSTLYRGPLLIHAGKKFDDAGFAWIAMNHKRLAISLDNIPNLEFFKRGGFLGIVDLVDCVMRHDSPWFFGPRGLVFKNPRLLDQFITFPGRLGIFEVPEGTVKL